MPRLIWSHDASEDLFNLYLSIGARNPQAAERTYTAIEELANLLRSYPRLGVRRPEYSPTFRMLIEGRYLLFYETVPDTNDGPIDDVYIVRVLLASRELLFIDR